MPHPALSAAVLLGFGRSTGDPATRRLRVVVAEADPARRERLRAALAAAGHDALCSGNWDAALGELSRTAVDAVVLALDLPKAGGLAAARRLRAWPAPVSALPLLALHAGGGAPLQERDWRGAGFDALLRWPEDLERLPTLVREAAQALATLCEAIGAVAAAAAARAAAERFPPETAPLMGALAAAGAAIRFEGRRGRR